jgi:signal transduction histidine kinase
VRPSAEPVRIDIDADVRPAVAVTDGERVRAVLVNVLGNAQQATLAASRAGGRIAVRVSRVRADRWRITVTDNGPGIAPGDLPRIFEPFFTTRRGGSGLGLAIARNIIDGLGGTIGVDSRPGCFPLTLRQLVIALFAKAPPPACPPWQRLTRI